MYVVENMMAEVFFKKGCFGSFYIKHFKVLSATSTKA
jgi:hypothetical protein